MSEHIVLKQNPTIEFQFHDHGFQLVDEQTEGHTGFYSYNDLQAVKLSRVWFPRLSKWMRVITTFTNGVPFFPDADSYKFASVIIQSGKKKLGIWLTDTKMANNAKRLKILLDEKTNQTDL